MSEEKEIKSFEDKEIGAFMQGNARGKLSCPESPEKAEELGQSDMATLRGRFAQ